MKAAKRSARVSRAQDTIREMADDAGLVASVHAARLPTEPPQHLSGDSVAVDAERVLPISSLYKLALAGCWADEVRAGALNPTDQITHRADTRAPGATGIACLGDDATLSQRDSVRLMLAASDNAAADALLQLITLEHLSGWVARHHLRDTCIRLGAAESLRTLIRETGGHNLADALTHLADPAHDHSTSQYNSALASSSTAHDLTRLLGLLWGDDTYAWVRQSMALQHFEHRLRSGFPHDDVDVHSKTGTLGRLRHEAAVVRFPHELPIAVAVLTVSARPEKQQPRVEAAIGRIARTAVNALRAPV